METKEPFSSLDEKQQKALLKAQRKAEFEAKFNKQSDENKSQEKSTKSKAELKAERRSKQEAQRAAKSEGTQKQTQSSHVVPKLVPVLLPISPLKEHVVVANDSINIEEKIIPIANKELPNKIFAHIPRRILDLCEASITSIPTSIIQVGYRINKESIKGSTAKCVAMLAAFKIVIKDHQPSPKKDFKRELQKKLFTDCLKFLAKCRPLSISMDNAVKNLKLVFSRISSDLNDDEVKQKLTEEIDTFIEDEILCSWKAIVKSSLEKINNDDIILTLGCSTLMKHVFYNAATKGKQFTVVVVDTRPRFEGREMLQFLINNNIPATYILINSISYVMKEVTKVMISAQSLFGNGYVMSCCGSSQIALVAKAYNVPVIVCCETYKFSDRVHTDCFVHNELGDDNNTFFDSLGKKDTIDSNCLPNLNVLDLLYDLTPHEFVSVIITEKGMLPCTSVPAILRVRETK